MKDWVHNDIKLCTVYSIISIASSVHWTSQARHMIHSSSATTTDNVFSFFSWSSKTSTGQVSIQVPQPLHFTSSILTDTKHITSYFGRSNKSRAYLFIFWLYTEFLLLRFKHEEKIFLFLIFLILVLSLFKTLGDFKGIFISVKIACIDIVDFKVLLSNFNKYNVSKVN